MINIWIDGRRGSGLWPCWDAGHQFSSSTSNNMSEWVLGATSHQSTWHTFTSPPTLNQQRVPFSGLTLGTHPPPQWSTVTLSTSGMHARGGECRQWIRRSSGSGIICPVSVNGRRGCPRWKSSRRRFSTFKFWAGWWGRRRWNPKSLLCVNYINAV